MRWSQTNLPMCSLHISPTHSYPALIQWERRERELMPEEEVEGMEVTEDLTSSDSIGWEGGEEKDISRNLRNERLCEEEITHSKDREQKKRMGEIEEEEEEDVTILDSRYFLK